MTERRATPLHTTLLTVSALLFCGEATAMRCGQRLITEGDHESKLLRYCGEPVSVQSRMAPRVYVRGDARPGFIPGFYEYVQVQEWTYNFGPRKFMRQVRIENGIVTDITELGYGYLD